MRRIVSLAAAAVVACGAAIGFAAGAGAEVRGPDVFSSAYPSTQVNLDYNVGVPGEFDLQSWTEDTEWIDWWIDGGPSGRAAADERDDATVTIAPPRAGWLTLFARSVERDGTTSATSTYDFFVDNGPTVTGPVEDLTLGMELHYSFQPRRAGVTEYVFAPSGLPEVVVPARADGTAELDWMIPGKFEFLYVRTRTADGVLSEPRVFRVAVGGVWPLITQTGGVGVNMPISFRAVSALPGVKEYVAVLDRDESTRQVVAAGADRSATFVYSVAGRGQHSVVVHAVNAAGVSSDSNIRQWTASDRPLVTSEDFPDDSAGRFAPGTFTITPRLGGTTAYEYSFDSAPTATLPARADGSATLDWTPATTGEHHLSVRAVTASGARSELTAVYAFTVEKRTGLLRSIQPSQVAAGAVRTFTVGGTELHPADRITITDAGGKAVTAQVKSVAADLTSSTVTADLTTAKPGAATVTRHSGATGGLAGTISLLVGPPPALKLTKAPAITGTARVGGKVTATPGTWSPAATSVKYQWKANGTAIKGATAATYVIPASLAGKKLTVTVTAARTGATTATATSASTAAVAKAAAAKATRKPAITGTPRAGRTVTATAGTWSPKVTSYAYEWRLNGTLVKGATGRTLKLTTAMRGKKLTVTVVARLAGHLDGRATSAAVKVRP
ncbi:hypothetical protein [Actinoplanes sp. RD1]|uniref:hypothetical protein n=1 Tax=Actinoplanes sp. RD1 TaxID=3064538 RepID=UPI0027421366|nr:hypothetical protein [Actinoplanes sp. RD1]